MQMIEIQGGGPHDGTQLTLPTDCVAVVLVSERSDGEYVSSISTRHGWNMVPERLADCLTQLAERLPNQA